MKALTGLTCLPQILAIAACLGSLAETGKAGLIFHRPGTHPATITPALTFSNLILASDSFSVTVSGSMPEALPEENRHALYFVNSVANASPGFALGDFDEASSKSFSGAESFRSFYGLGTGGAQFGDYIVINFSQDFSPGQSMDGILSGHWDAPALDPSQVSKLNVFWGSDSSLGGNGGSITGGILIGSSVPVNAAPATVPEVSSALLASLGGLFAFRRHRPQTA